MHLASGPALAPSPSHACALMGAATLATATGIAAAAMMPWLPEL